MNKFLLGIFCLICSTLVFSNEIISMLDERMKTTNSLVCVGLDPDISKYPGEIADINGMTVEDKTLIFLKEIIDITANDSCAFKIQKAFFDLFPNGHNLLKSVIAYIHAKYKDIPVFVDCKIGDIDNTMDAYMTNLFDNLQADGVVVNPYMGLDVVYPFLQDPKRMAIVLIQTSNLNAKTIQEIKLANGEALWMYILKLMVNKWNLNNNLIPVLASTGDNYKEIRKLIPQNMPILLAGVGAQGGELEWVKHLLNKDKRGVFVNSSRGILYPYSKDDPDWRKKVLNEELKLKNELNKLRE